MLTSLVASTQMVAFLEVEVHVAFVVVGLPFVKEHTLDRRGLVPSGSSC